MSFFCLGGNFSIFPTEVTRSFGPVNNGVVYGLVFVSQAIASLLGVFTMVYIRDAFGWVATSLLMAFVGALGAIVAFTFRSPADEYDRKQMENTLWNRCPVVCLLLTNSCQKYLHLCSILPFF